VQKICRQMQEELSVTGFVIFGDHVSKNLDRSNKRKLFH
jgi:hypothetical protein